MIVVSFEGKKKRDVCIIILGEINRYRCIVGDP